MILDEIIKKTKDDLEKRKIDFCILKYAKMIINCTNKCAINNNKTNL